MRVFAFLCIMLFASACNRIDIYEEWAKEEAKLAEWISENAPDADFIPDKDIYFEIIRRKPVDNIAPETGDHVLVNFISSFLDGTIEEVSFKDGPAKYNALLHSKYLEGGPELWNSDYWSRMGVGEMREKEKANIYIPSRMLNLQDFKTRKIEIELVQVIEDLRAYQEGLMNNFMEKNFCKNFDTDTITINGRELIIFFHIDNSKAGDEEADFVSVRTFDEYYFLQENDFRVCALNQTDKKKWEKSIFSEMFKSVKKGDVITAMMPYRVMYGEESYIYAPTKQTIAPLGSVLKYKIDFIDP